MWLEDSLEYKQQREIIKNPLNVNNILFCILTGHREYL